MFLQFGSSFRVGMGNALTSMLHSTPPANGRFETWQSLLLFSKLGKNETQSADFRFFQQPTRQWMS
jgi:hypothetical protein